MSTRPFALASRQSSTACGTSSASGLSTKTSFPPSRSALRFPTEGVLPRLEQRLGERVVARRGGRDDDALHLGVTGDLAHVPHRAHARVLRRGLREPLRVGVAHADEARAREAREVANQVRAPVTGADDGDADPIRHESPPGGSSGLQRWLKKLLENAEGTAG